MKVMFAFTGIFFVLFIIILFFAMSSGAIDCSTSVVCRINDDTGFFTFTVYPLGIGTIVFIILGRVFYSLAYKERKLLTVEEYKAEQQRKALERLKQMKKEEAKEKADAIKVEQENAQNEEPEVEILNDKEDDSEEAFVRKAGPLTKTRLIAIISEHQSISLIDARGFVNALFKVATIRLNNDDDVDFEGFGRLEKINGEEGAEIEFFPYGELSETLGLDPFEYETFSVPKTPNKPKKAQKEAEREALLEKVKKKEARDEMIEEVKKTVTLKKKKKRTKIAKKDLILRISEEHDISKNKADKFLKGLTTVIQDTLVKRDDVVIDQFGKFTTIEMPAKKAVNPQTNESIVVPAHHQVRVRFNSKFEDDIND
jgi:nucleoid DNA-binding protein